MLGNFEVKVDGQKTSASMAQAGSLEPTRPKLFEKEVQYGNHSLSVTNTGEYLLLDAIEIGMILGAQG